MKKLFAVIISASVCLSALASCGDKKEAAPEKYYLTTTENAATTPSSTAESEPANSEATTETVESTEVTEPEASTDATEETSDSAEVTDATEIATETPAVTTEATVATTEAPVVATEVTTTATEAPVVTTAPPAESAPINKEEIASALEEELSALKNGTFEEGSYAANSPFANEDSATYSALFANFSYTVGEVTVIDANTATVDTTITMVDLGAALMTYMQELTLHSGEENWDEDFSEFYRILSSENATLATNNVKVNMVKTENGWTVSDDNSELKNAISGSISSSGLLG